MLTDNFSSQKEHSEHGAVLVLVLSLTAVLLGAAALAMDVSNARMERVRLQVAADAGAYAGVAKLIASGTSLQAENTARVIAGANTAPNFIDTAEAGRWDGANFTPGTASPNAVRVTASEAVPTGFARIWGQRQLFPKVRSIVSMATGDHVSCLVPFAIEEEYIERFDYGDVINIDRPSPGNWGKIDLSGNMSSGQQFVAAMRDGVCGRTLSIGDTISPGTGFAGVRNGFDARMGSNPIIVIPIVHEFYNGNQPVVIAGFVVAQLIGQGHNGANWSGEIRLLKKPAGSGSNGPAGAPYAPTPVFVQ